MKHGPGAWGWGLAHPPGEPRGWNRRAAQKRQQGELYKERRGGWNQFPYNDNKLFSYEMWNSDW